MASPPCIYRVYGLRVRSEIALPELERVEEPRWDAEIRLGPARALAGGRAPEGHGLAADARQAFASIPNVGALLAREGREVIVEPDDDADEGLLRAVLLGSGLALLLHQRERFVLHASAVALDGGAVALLGEKGYGKSTTAAALLRRGHPLVTDDLLVVEMEGETTVPVAVPGFTQIKLWPDAVAATVGDAADALPRLYASSEKRRWQEAALAREPVPLRAIYVLGVGAAIAARRLPPREALTALLRHSYLREILTATGREPLHLTQCAALIRRVPIYRLERPRNLGGLPALAQYIEHHTAALADAEAASASLR